jgi:hypothetical protein
MTTFFSQNKKPKRERRYAPQAPRQAATTIVLLLVIACLTLALIAKIALRHFSN